MELDDLKKSYKPIAYSRKELEGIFEMRTKRSVKKLNRTMLTDALTMLLTAGILISTTFLLGLSERYFITLEIVTLVVLLLIHYRVKYSLLNNIDFYETGLKEGLQKLLRRVTYYMNTYKIVVPLFSTLLYLKTIIATGNLSFPFMAITLPVAFTMFILTRYICDRIYGNEIDTLRALYLEFDKE